MSTGSAVAWNMPNRLNFLTIVPMFHCNGWGYPWTIPMLNGRTICLRNIDVKKIFELIDKYEVTHFGGAPIVLNMLANAPKDQQKKLKDHKNMIANLKKGDRIVTQGGIIGNIHYVNDDGTLSVEIADNVNVKVAKGMVADIAAK